ncbi:hypothetical protein [Carboxylicivirga sp. N1Y90]|uniref:hypothetical protein n=1 Tax=Carboxylicivirga fragile TaxID=3417571 RepID=UPI003D34B406|nr:hypothetical protein [Marinilabiliaceae bacterium N1Y90]
MIQRILLYASLTILVGHTLVSHSHKTESFPSSIRQSNELQLWDLIQGFLSTNIGSEHLEKYKLVDSDNEKVLFSIYLDDEIQKIVIAERKNHCPYKLNKKRNESPPINTTYIHGPTTLRGSPYLY